jgi:hypothetical protein
MKLMVQRFLGRSRLAETLIENWRIAHQEETFATDVAALLGECLELRSLTRQTWSALLELLFSNEHNNGIEVEEFGKTLKIALVKTLEVFTTVQTLLEEAQQKGYTIGEAGQFAAIHQEVIQIKAEVGKAFPEYDRNMAEQARAAFHRGEYRTVEDLLREAQNNHP